MKGAKLTWLFGILLVAAGFLPAAVFSLGALLPGTEASALLAHFPALPWLSGAERWLLARRIRWAPSSGLVFALFGVVLMMLGAAIAQRQRPFLQAMRAKREDARRRRRQYAPAERIEPTLL